ncbi:MAG: DUF1858 domain-containing protein [Campylobacterota bacterium]|nr:DUF1858 domain-containing protein [Campylobacterota bacterium]
MNITLETKIADLLNSRPDMKDILIAINPKFKKLNNPVLRRTLARLASVKQAAVVGGMDAIDLLNQIRIAIGEEPIDAVDIEVNQREEGKAPKWIKKKPKAELDANALLDRDENPLAEITKEMHHLEKGDVIKVTVDFKPEPLIDELLKRGHKVYTEEGDKGFITYIKKK